MSNQSATYDILLGRNTFSRGLRDIDADLGKTEGKISMLGSVVGGNLISSAISGAASALKDLAVGAFQGYGKFEQFGVALKTMFHGNKLEAQGLSDELVDIAKKTPFELEELQGATRQLIAYGSNSRQVGNELKMLGDISAGVSAPIGEIAYLYGTARTQGRLFSRDIYQLSGRGIPIVQALAKQFKITDDKVMKLVEDGKVGFPQMQKALSDMTKEGGQFYHMMDEQSHTLLGTFSNLKDAWGQFEVKLGESRKGVLKDLLDWSVEFLNGFQQAQGIYNQVNDARKNSGTDNQNWFQRNFPMGRDVTGNMQNMQIFINGNEAAIKSRLEKNDIKGALKIASEVEAQLNEDKYLIGVKGFGKGTINNGEKVDRRGFQLQEVQAEYAMLTESRRKITQMESQFLASRKDKPTKLNGLGDATTGTGTTIEAGTPKVLNINITNFLPEWSINSVDGSIPTKDMKEKVGAAFLELVNDAHLAVQ